MFDKDSPLTKENIMKADYTLCYTVSVVNEF